MRTQVGQNLFERVRVSVGLRERQPDLAHADPRAGAELQQLQPDRGALGPGVGGAGQPQAAQSMHQHIVEGGNVQPQLIGPQRQRCWCGRRTGPACSRRRCTRTNS